MTDPTADFRHDARGTDWTASSGPDALAALKDEVTRAGFYPDVVMSMVDTALGGENCESFLVQPETTFADTFHRHVTLLALTVSRLIVIHVDDVVGEDGVPTAMASSEAVALSKIQAVGVTHAVRLPASDGGTLTEMALMISWGAVRRFDIEPTTCPDPECEADHGFTGGSVPDDIHVRVAAGVEGQEALERAEQFARALSAAVARVASRI